MDRCSTCGYRWVSSGWTCPRCGYGSSDDSSGGDGCGCTEGCLLPLGCLAALVIVPTVLVLLLAAMTHWAFWAFVGIVALVVGLVKFVPWWQARNAPPWE